MWTQGLGVQNRAADHPLGHIEWSPPTIEIVMQDMSYPIAAMNVKVTIRSLAADSPEYSVPFMAAVTHSPCPAYLFNGCLSKVRTVKE